ncbi:MAG: amidohydrolase [Proteobacteria bacterium]|nr:amidohydrolase [Pseudomonadota bacterium]
MADPTHAWLIGYGLSPDLVLAKELNRKKLDALVPDRPAFLATEDGFTVWVNSKALQLGGIDPNSTGPQIDGVERDPTTHKPTGILKSDATNLVRQKIPQPTEAEYREALKLSTTTANRFGITSIFDASATAPMLEAYHDADRENELTVRIVAAQRIDNSKGPEQIDAMIALRDRLRGTRFRADAAKIFLDVEISDHSAAMLEPYADMPNARGELLIQTDALNAIVRRLDAEGFSIHMHAMGDRAVRAGLDAIEQAMNANEPRDRRHQIAHIGVADPADIVRFCKLGVTANFQPRFASADDPVYTPSKGALGPKRARWMYPMTDIAACGARIVASSDWPQPSMNPLDEIQAALTRPPADASQQARQAQERVDLAFMLVAYTKNAAWVAREEAIDGSIEVGKAADLVVLDRNLFKMKAAAIHSARVLLTLLDGEVVHRDPNF